MEKVFDTSLLAESIQTANINFHDRMNQEYIALQKKRQDRENGIAFLDKVCLDLMALSPELRMINVLQTYRKDDYDQTLLFVFVRHEIKYEIAIPSTGRLASNGKVYDFLLAAKITVQDLYNSLCYQLKLKN